MGAGRILLKELLDFSHSIFSLVAYFSQKGRLLLNQVFGCFLLTATFLNHIIVFCIIR